MHSFALTSLLLFLLMSTMASANNMFGSGNVVLSESLFSKESRIIGGTQVSIEPFVTSIHTSSAHVISFVAVCSSVHHHHHRSHSRAFSHENITSH